GFVSISSNAEIRLGGFGLAEALLNSLHRPRIAREVAPYAAPEARETGEVGPDSDVYSVGVLLVELLTGRRPRRTNPAEALEDAGRIPEELRALVLCALAPSGQRYPSIDAMHRALEELLTASPYALYTGNLALFLYRLLNPEGHNVVDAADGEATNPVEAEAPEPEAVASAPPLEALLPAVREPRYNVALATLPAAVDSAAPPRTVWIGRVGLAVATSLVAAGVFFPGHRSQSAPRPTAAPATSVAEALPTRAPALDSLPPSARTSSGTRAPEPGGRALSASAPRGRASERQASTLLARRSAESLRLRAALARIDADRLDAEVIARDLYAEAQSNEKEGSTLLHQGFYKPAQPVLMRATQLYRMAEDVSREERVRLVRLSSPQ
ncbi:MAG: protein kinase domain-containing protein, partial [Thermoanaerobaculia bacterium]